MHKQQKKKIEWDSINLNSKRNKQKKNEKTTQRIKENICNMVYIYLRSG